MMIETTLRDLPLTFETGESVFSPAAVDRGTLAMLSAVEFAPDDKVLDLGCGYGVVGILAGVLIGGDRVVLCDVSEDAVRLAKRNAVLNGLHNMRVIQSDGFAEIPDRDLTLILSNPPYHTDFSVAKRFIEEGFRRLAVGGRMVMVTKRLDWYKNKLTTVFGGVRVAEIDGYYVFTAEKRQAAVKKKEKPQNGLSKKLARKQNRRGKAGGR